MFSLIKNQRGNTMVITLMGLAVAGGALMISQQNLKVQKVERELVKRAEGEVIVDKLRALASFLIANNVIVCKQGAFKSHIDHVDLVNDDPSSDDYEKDNEQIFKDYGHRCLWTGTQVSNGVAEEIKLADVKFSNMRYFGFNEDGTINKDLKDHKDFGALVFDVDTVNLINKNQVASDEQIEPLRGSISFRLYDFGDNNDPLGLRERIGVESIAQSAADDDHFAVLIKAEATYNRVFGAKQDENNESQRYVKKDEKIERYFAIRRPIAIPKIDIDTPECQTSCDSSLSSNNNPECRGPMGFDNIVEVQLTGRVTNQGPGVLYNLKLEKSVEYDQNLYPNRENPEPKGIHVLGNRDYLLPGETAEWTDSITCEVFKTTVDETYRCSNWRQNAAGNPLCWDSNGNEVDPAADNLGADDNGVDQHDEVAGQIYYRLQAGNEDIYKDPIGVLEENINDVTIYYDGQVLNKALLDQLKREMIDSRDVVSGDRLGGARLINTSLFKKIRLPMGVPLRSPSNTEDKDKKSAEWKSIKSTIEPKRIITDISAEEGFPRKKETTVNIKIIPTH
tara:strand:+ start:55541 stop:57232 length:1692 start_codon:yes stop_codon:yes gene_type:complete